jgi:TusA-related sulfurtransferase
MDDMITFDLRKKLIPFSLLQITNVFNKMQPGEVIEILAGTGPVDTAIFNDVLRILPRTQYDLVAREQGTAKQPVTRIKLRKSNSYNQRNHTKEEHHVHKRSEFS